MACPKLIEQIQRPERFFPVEVWKAAYPGLLPASSPGSDPDGLAGRTVVVKLVKDESNSTTRQWGQRLQDLGSKAKKVNSPGVARTLDVGPDAGVIYVVTEYLNPAEGWKSLDEEAPKNTTLMVDQSLRIIYQVSQALAAMEDAGIVHGCITPSKVMVAPYPGDRTFHQVKLRDVGLGHLRIYDDISAISLQLAMYLAPELLDMDRSPDVRSDIFSLGAVFLRILGGYPPVVGDNVNEIFEKKFSAKGPPPIQQVRPDIDKNESPGLDRVLGKMLAREPDQRYQSAHELSAALEDLARSFGIRLLPAAPVVKKPVEEVWRDRELVVAKFGASFPHRCLLCNRDSGDIRMFKTLHWHSNWLYALAVFPGLLIYAIVAAIVEKSTEVEIGLCARHRRQQWISLSIMWILIVGGIAALAAAYLWRSIPAAGAGIVLLGAGAIVDLGFRTLLGAKNMENRYVWITGAGPKFLDSLPDYDG